MRQNLTKILRLFALAIAIVVAPQLHSFLGCDDDASSVAAHVARQADIDDRGEEGNHQPSLPDGACCELALAVGAVAYSNARTRPALRFDSGTTSNPPTTLAFGSRGFLQKIGILRTRPHPPPPLAPIFLTIQSFLI